MDLKTAGAWATTCLNCGAPLDGHFCADCGQRAVPPNPTLRELAAESLSELTGWDGKIAATARLLIRKPGALTCESLAGRRARYIPPLRLYLTFSVAFFVLAASAPQTNPMTISFNSGVAVGRGDPGKVVVPIDAEKNAALAPEDRRRMLAKVATAPRVLRPLMQRLVSDPRALQKGVVEALPKGLFLLLPVFAGILTVFYRKRHFAEHLYFALHLHTFVFLALAFRQLLKFTGSGAVATAAGIVALGWILVYAHLSFRRVYGNSHTVTLLKEVGIGALYAAAAIPTVVGVVLWVARS